MLINGAEILMECLLEQDVDIIFGYPGGAVLNIYDALYQYSDKLNHILTAHEQGAAHAADGYARATGKVGVCLATSGPGATNLVTGIATAYMDSIPMVAITGNVPLELLGKDSFQEIDITGITLPITKHNYLVKDIDNLAPTIRNAFSIARSGRPGPVLIDIPKDITAQKGNYTRQKLKPELSCATYDSASLKKAAHLITAAAKPLIYSGGGVIYGNASAELGILAKKIQAPVATSLMGLGSFSGTDPAFTGLIGMHGSKASNLAATECDLLIAIGARFSDRVISKVEGFAPHAKILHIDIDPAEIDKNVRTYYSLIGSLKEILPALTKMLPKEKNDQWINRVKKWKELYPDTYRQNLELSPQYIIEMVDKISGGEAIITTEVGQNQICAAQYYKYTKPRTFISSGGLGTMGFGIGAAIGAQLGSPGKLVINFAGDGCFRMNCIELATAVKYGIPIKVFILNNGVLGMVRQWQSLFYTKRYSQTTLDQAADYVKIAEAFGATGYTLERNEDVEKIIMQSIKTSGPVVVNCKINQDSMVLPIIPPGALIKDEVLK